jgi:hypothetical protein
MTDNSLVTNNATDATSDLTENQATTAKTFTQEEVNAILARTKSQLEKKFSSRYEDLGDPDELRTIKSEWEKKQQEQQIKRGEFEKTLQELASRKDAEIQKRDSIIKDYRVNTPLLSAAAKYNAVNAEQVKALLSQQVRLNQEGEVEVVDSKGAVRYNDAGEPLNVDTLVKEFLDQNAHFKLAAPSTTNTKSNISAEAGKKIDISKLDMSKPEHRKIYAEHRKTNGLA